MGDVYLLNKRESKLVLSRPTGLPNTPIAELVLEAGSNGPFDAEEVAKFRANAIVEKAFFKSGVVQVHVPDVSTPDDTVLREIATCDDLRQLRQWIDTRGHREDWRAAVIRRHAEITESESSREADYV